MSASGNLCVWNHVNIGSGGTTTLTEGNLKCTMTGADPRTTGTLGGTCADTNGWYFEIEATNIGDGALTVGIVNDIRNGLCLGGQIHQRSDSYMWRSYSSGQFFNGSTNVTSYGSFANGDILSFYVKSDKLYVYKNNSAVVGNVSTGTSGLSIGGTFFFPAVSRTVGGGGTSICVLKPNSDSWSYTPPSGFKGLTAKDLLLAEEVDPSEGNGSNKYHDTIIYTGTGSTRSITSLNFQPDWVLIKNRDQTDGWLNQNSVSGVGKTHEWNDDGPYEDETDCITSFNSDGFTLSDDHKVNASTEKYVAYCWKKSVDAGFDIVEYSGNGSTNNVSHSLGAEPDCIMMHLKSGSDWDSTMYFNSPSMGTGEGVFWTLANAGQTTTYMTSVSSSTFTPTSSANTSTRTYVAYLFRSIPGFSHFGEFEGNGDANGPFIYTGFRPKFVFFKAIDATENWQIRDTARQTYNDGTTPRIYWNSNAAEAATNSTASPIDFLANGFKIRGSNTEINSNTIIYGAWGDVPYKYNNTRA